MMQVQQSSEIIWKRLCNVGEAVGAMAYKVDQIAKRNEALVIRRGWCLHEKLQVGLVLAVLVAEIISV